MNLQDKAMEETENMLVEMGYEENKPLFWTKGNMVAIIDEYTIVAEWTANGPNWEKPSYQILFRRVSSHE